MRATRVGVQADRTGEEVGVLGDAVETGTEGLPRDKRDILAVDGDGTVGGGEHAEEGEEERGFTRAGTAAYADFLTGRDREGNIFEDELAGPMRC